MLGRDAGRRTVPRSVHISEGCHTISAVTEQVTHMWDAPLFLSSSRFGNGNMKSRERVREGGVRRNVQIGNKGRGKVNRRGTEEGDCAEVLCVVDHNTPRGYFGEKDNGTSTATEKPRISIPFPNTRMSSVGQRNLSLNLSQPSTIHCTSTCMAVATGGSSIVSLWDFETHANRTLAHLRSEACLRKEREGEKEREIELERERGERDSLSPCNFLPVMGGVGIVSSSSADSSPTCTPFSPASPVRLHSHSLTRSFSSIRDFGGKPSNSVTTTTPIPLSNKTSTNSTHSHSGSRCRGSDSRNHNQEVVMDESDGFGDGLLLVVNDDNDEMYHSMSEGSDVHSDDSAILLMRE